MVQTITVKVTVEDCDVAGIKNNFTNGILQIKLELHILI